MRVVEDGSRRLSLVGSIAEGRTQGAGAGGFGFRGQRCELCGRKGSRGFDVAVLTQLTMFAVGALDGPVSVRCAARDACRRRVVLKRSTGGAVS